MHYDVEGAYAKAAIVIKEERQDVRIVLADEGNKPPDRYMPLRLPPTFRRLTFPSCSFAAHRVIASRTKDIARVIVDRSPFVEWGA
jgi:hypothetical protein